ncbi:Protein of unknown function [Pyronema omphalodes CBS 100304]|uniref:Uncharacterized protein n=1 Tax=Pyronema omphalodes (strain CBS 100304) TaxID=1076935 RepID=U4LIL9_PYROM|nr:Protein of unknown function [Pyronema omphalodes CBS 100304]
MTGLFHASTHVVAASPKARKLPAGSSGTSTQENMSVKFHCVLNDRVSGELESCFISEVNTWDKLLMISRRRFHASILAIDLKERHRALHALLNSFNYPETACGRITHLFTFSTLQGFAENRPASPGAKGWPRYLREITTKDEDGTLRMTSSAYIYVIMVGGWFYLYATTQRFDSSFDASKLTSMMAMNQRDLNRDDPLKYLMDMSVYLEKDTNWNRPILVRYTGENSMADQRNHKRYSITTLDEIRHPEYFITVISDIVKRVGSGTNGTYLPGPSLKNTFIEGDNHALISYKNWTEIVDNLCSKCPVNTDRKSSRRYGHIFVARQPEPDQNKFRVTYKDEYFFRELAHDLVPEFLMLGNPAGGKICANNPKLGGSELSGRRRSGRSTILHW